MDQVTYLQGLISEIYICRVEFDKLLSIFPLHKRTVAERSRSRFSHRPLARTAGWNPAGGMDVCLLRAFFVVSVSGRSLRERSPTDCCLSK